MRTRVFGVLSSLFLCLGPGLTEEPAPRQKLFDFGPDFDVRTVVAQDTKVDLVDGKALLVRTGSSSEYPGITLKAPRGKWDLSSCLHIEAALTNRGANDVTVFCRVDNPGADGDKNCLTGQVVLSAGASGKLRVDLSSTPWRLSKPLELIGMRGWPKATEKLDPANVTQLLFFVVKPEEEHAFEIGAISAGGKAVLLDADKFLPFIDELGQFIHAEWPGKTRSADELKERIAAEEKELAARPGPADWNKYGGWTKGPQLSATGFFRVEKYQGKWWLVDPEGRLFWSHGSDCVRSGNATPITDRQQYFRGLPAEGSPLARFYGSGSWAPHGYYKDHSPYRTFDFAQANLFRRYGEDWENLSALQSHRRLRSWGMNTIANWSDARTYLLRKTPYVVSISFNSKPIEGSEGYWGRFHDVFDRDFRQNLRRRLEGEKNVSVGDPWCIGYFVHNELGWGDEVSLAVGALASPAEQPAKVVFVEDLKATYGSVEKLNEAWGTAHASWEAFLESRVVPDKKKAWKDLTAFYSKIAETYFQTVRDELKAVARDQLYLGCRFAWVNERAARAAAKYCDIVSHNFYTYDVERVSPPVGIDKPMIIGEFHFGALDRGMFHTGLKPTASQEDRAAKYRSYVQGAVRNPYLVGAHWFQYQDQATTGRGDGENYQIGLVDICDNPYPETIDACREVGYGMYEHRLKAPLFVDPFLSPPARPWTWIRESPENRKTDGGLCIRLEPGGLMGGAKDARNILIRPLPAEARSVAVNVETHHASQFEQAGLILYGDDDNYVKLVREFVDGSTWIVLVVEVAARPNVAAKVPLPEGETTWLCMEIQGEKIKASGWGDSKAVVTVGEVDFPPEILRRVGIFTQSGQAGADRWARFRDFSIRRAP